ncbi:HAMP domain-containing sensor histidine kinase [Desulfosporosinus nitroreducens]|uniref:HAMP domain-containing sensor histidine kinase n=1 Tax=Desulfosporosinus nitroreducens TaxID=2018668 RepID=UPI00207C36F1|nr:ATP-binding protein [Desulfosporosinus nitroreducens]MCO1602348.1 cell wall metabolism sensor histidine kinase WalK [Desulfosporosinus nitroreducens]
MFREKISFKLTASFVIIMLISMLAIGLLFIQMFRQYAFDSREETMLVRARSIAEVMAENSENFGQIRGLAGTMRFLDTMAEANVWITDSKGNPSTKSEMGMGMGKGSGNGQKSGFGKGMGQGQMYNSEPLPLEAEAVIQEVLKGKESVSESFSSVYNEATLTVGVPIVDSDHRVIGSVLLHTPVTGVTATLNKAVRILAISLFVALLLAIGLGIFYSLLFTRPLKAMNSTALEITRGNYSARTGINRKDELGQLGNSLDHLALKLGHTINQLFQEKGKLDDIISSISEGIVAFDTTLKPISVNTALAEIMNRPQPYLIEAVEEDLNSLEIEAQLTRVMEDKKPAQVFKDWLGKKLKLTLSPIIDNHGMVTGSVALVQDISQSERLEQLRRDFVANVSHEFRTPLTVIRGSVEGLVDGMVENSEDIKRYHQRILSETRGLERLVGDLMELSRLQSGKIMIHKNRVHISSLLADLVKSLQTIADQKEIKILYQPESDLPPFLGDYDRLRQLFVIFLDNAIKYSPANTLVWVESRIIENNTLSIIIRDQGYGIANDELPYIWDRFYKVDSSRKGLGTGLGLAIAKHLLELHDGKVSVQSELGKGTEIEIKLPM